MVGRLRVSPVANLSQSFLRQAPMMTSSCRKRSAGGEGPKKQSKMLMTLNRFEPLLGLECPVTRSHWRAGSVSAPKMCGKSRTVKRVMLSRSSLASVIRSVLPARRDVKLPHARHDIASMVRMTSHMGVLSALCRRRTNGIHGGRRMNL